MNVAGLIVEYNPFHNGHMYHLQESISHSGADYTIAVMSGHFLQRGAPALVDKWCRASMAVAAGVDLILELPYAYCAQSAETFAHGAVSILEATGMVTHLCFGSEEDTIDPMLVIAKFLAVEPPEYQSMLREYLNIGHSYPAARQEALLRYRRDNSDITLKSVPANKLKDIMGKPNAILAIEYLKALFRSNSTIQPVLIPRIGASYHDTTFSSGSIASATAIRTVLENSLQEGSYNDVLTPLRSVMPPATVAVMQSAFDLGRGPVFSRDFSTIILSLLRRKNTVSLEGIADIREGMEYRIQQAAQKSGTLGEILQRSKTKRYPQTTLQRIMFHVLLGYTQKDASLFSDFGPQYIRVLGFSEKGQILLKQMKKSASLPILQRIAPALPRLATNHPILERMLQLDMNATDLYTLAFANPTERYSGQDMTHPVVRSPL
jgi:predicted nucleotidyltransferase